MSELPANIISEQGLVSCILQGFDAPPDMGPEWFIVRRNWDVIQLFVECGRTSREEFVSWLVEHRKLEGLGGPGILAELMVFAPASDATVKHYAKMLRASMIRRKLIALASEMQSAASLEGDTDMMLDGFESAVLGIRKGAEDHADDVTVLRDVLLEAVEDIEARSRAFRAGRLQGIASGFPALDEITGGFQPGRVYILGARPKMGKTSFLRQILTYASGAGPVYFATMEMTKKQTAEMMIATASKIDAMKVNRGDLSEHDMKVITNSLAKLAPKPIWMDHRISTATRVDSVVRRLVKRNGVKLLALDYLQLCAAANPEEERSPILRITNASQRMVRIAKENNIPVIALVQLNRDAENVELEALTMRNIRDCGQIEADASFIAFLGRQRTGTKVSATDVNTLTGKSKGAKKTDNHAMTADNSEIALRVIANRYGPSGDIIPLNFDGPTLTFTQKHHDN